MKQTELPGAEPDRVERIALMLQGSTQTHMKAAVRPIVLRVPVTTLADLDAMAKLAGKSRNIMAIHLLDAAIESVRAQIPEGRMIDLDTFTIEELSKLVTEEVPDDQIEG